MDRLCIEITLNEKTFTYESGADAFIFHSGVYNDVHKRFGFDGLSEYVPFVHECYIHDDNHTPLGDLADFIATHFKRYRKMNYYKVLEKFYEQLY